MKSDEKLVREGIGETFYGRVIITDEQYRILREEMEGNFFYRQQVEEAKKLIGEMPTGQFVAFQRELQYALKYHSAAYQRGQTCMFAAEPADFQRSSYERAADYCLHGRERIDAITKSPLYDAIRARIRKDYEGEQSLASDWVGWLGLEGKQDMDKINGAIDTMLRNDLPISGLIGGRTSDRQASEAEETVAGYGIQGIFVESLTDIELVARFHQCYGA